MPRFAVIIPACNEAEALPQTLSKLQLLLDPQACVIAVGANGCDDATCQIARESGVIVGETAQRGYGYGCQAAIEAANAIHANIEAYIFFAADGANDAFDISKLIAAYQEGDSFVLGQRTRLLKNWRIMTAFHILANRILGFWCGVLTGRTFCDLGPFRLISRPVFEALGQCEWTYGWTIESQILVVRLGFPTREIDVMEYPRIAGEQKVSHVNCRRTLKIGWQILAAGWRTRFRPLPLFAQPCPTPTHLHSKDFPNPV